MFEIAVLYEMIKLTALDNDNILKQINIMPLNLILMSVLKRYFIITYEYTEHGEISHKTNM